MTKLITIYTFTLPQECYIAKAKLESEGITVFLQDELTTQIYNFYSNSIGGVKLQVPENETTQAIEILNSMGFVIPIKEEKGAFWKFTDKFTLQIPFINKLAIEVRAVILLTLLILLIVLPLILFGF